MIFIDNTEMLECISYEEVMEAVEKSYLLQKENKAYTPPRPVFDWKGNKAFFMPCFSEEAMGFKVLTQYPSNRSIGKPTLDGVMLLNDPQTGEVLAMMDGKQLTALRTGAMGGLACRYLASPDCKTAGIIGLGVQGLYQAIYVATEKNLDRLYLYDAYLSDYTEFADKFYRMTGKTARDVQVIPCESSEELAEKSEIIIAATTSHEPVVPNDSRLIAGKCLISVGSGRPDMREFPAAIWDVVDVAYVTLAHGMKESGDLSQPLEDGSITPDRIHLFDEILGGEVKLPREGKSNFFKGVGMALNDVVVAEKIYQNARDKGLGKVLEF